MIEHSADAMEQLFILPAVAILGALAAACSLTGRVRPLAPFAFVVAYIVALGAITWVDVVWFRAVDSRFGGAENIRWLQFAWPVTVMVFAPHASAALLACGLSPASTPRDTAVTLGFSLLYILMAIVFTGLAQKYGRIEGLLVATVTFVLLGAIFLAEAFRKRNAFSPP